MRWLLAALLTLAPAAASALTAGPNYPTVNATNTTSPNPPCNTTRAWAALANIKADDGAYSSNNPLNGNYGECLTVSNFGFTIPDDGIIDGITVEIKKWRNVGAPRYVDKGLYLMSPIGELYGTDHADTATDWPNPAAWVSHGGTADIWGTALTPAGINSTGFGVFLSISKIVGGSSAAKVDAIRITVTYHLPDTVFSTGICCSDAAGTSCETPQNVCAVSSACTTAPYTTCAGAPGDDVNTQGNATVFTLCRLVSPAQMDVGKCSVLGNPASFTALMQWDTSGLPDTATITSVRLRFGITENVINDDSKTLVADAYDWGGTCDSSDWTITDPTPAGSLAPQLLPHVAGTDTVDMSIATTAISMTGTTRLRLTATGVVPAIGTVGMCMKVWTYDATSVPGPQLLVSYNTATPTLTFTPGPSTPTFTWTPTPTATPTQSGWVEPVLVSQRGRSAP